MTTKAKETTIAPKTAITTVEDLRKLCDQVHNQRKEDVKAILTDWLEYSFMTSPKPWRAVIGNKKCKPIPIHRSFPSYKLRESYQKIEREPINNYFHWPDLPDKEIREIIESLGFVIAEHALSISVPAFEKGKPLTFAQEWVQKINNNYSFYVRTERKKARTYYLELISQLCTTPITNIETCDEYTLFEDFKFEPIMSRKCNRYLKKLLLENGIEEFYEEKKYKGIRILRQPSN